MLTNKWTRSLGVLSVANFGCEAVGDRPTATIRKLTTWALTTMEVEHCEIGFRSTS